MKNLLLLITSIVFITSCGGGGGGGGSTPSVPTPQNISVSLTSSADSAEVNSSITLTWSSTLATSCSASGSCETMDQDHGIHTVCAHMTDEFLAFSKSQGNDLSTPMPEYGFPGLKEGDDWCLCAPRWVEAYEANCAPKIYLTKTHEKTLELVPLTILKEYAIDIN